MNINMIRHFALSSLYTESKTSKQTVQHRYTVVMRNVHVDN